ncbi:MAG: hypothetical protein NC222_06605 [Staphylococcus sp.]|nr:hypothetical protein [Staphylococcus sp.]
MYNAVEFLESASKISNDLTSVIDNHHELEKKYIKENSFELLANLNKETKIVLSYLNGFEKSNLKTIKACLREVNKCGDLESVKQFSSPNKKIDFVTINHKYGKWSIASDKMSDKLEDLDVPTAMDYLTQIVARLTPQEAAYSLVHAKDNGSFILASMPYSTIEEGNTDFAEKNMKAPAYTFGNPDNEYVGTYHNSTPVSRQMAAEMPEEFSEESEEIVGGVQYKDKDDDTTYSITGIEDGKVYIANLDEPLTEEQVKSFIESGKWVKAAKVDEAKIKKIKNNIERLSGPFREYAIELEAIQKQVADFQQKLLDASAAKLERLNKDIEAFEPKLKKEFNKLEQLELKAESLEKKAVIVKERIGEVDWVYNPDVPDYRRKLNALKIVEQALKEMSKLVISDIAKFQELSEQMFGYAKLTEKLDYTVDSKNPKIREEIDERVKQLKKKVKTSLKTDCNKSVPYGKLDKMLFAGLIDFNVYNELCDFVEINAGLTNETVESIYKTVTSKPIYVKADLIETIKEKFYNAWGKIKDFFGNLFNFTSMQENKLDQINDLLDKAIEELQ